MPATVTEIAYASFNNVSALTSLIIHAGVETIDYGAFIFAPSLQSFSVAEDNPGYVTVDGVLFDKTMSTLIRYPAGKPGESYPLRRRERDHRIRLERRRQDREPVSGQRARDAFGFCRRA